MERLLWLLAIRLADMQLASVANFSRFHFNRIFYDIMGETPFQFISRMRMGKAAMLLRNAPNDTMTDIAIKCGFSELAVLPLNNGVIHETSDVFLVAWVLNKLAVVDIDFRNRKRKEFMFPLYKRVY